MKINKLQEMLYRSKPVDIPATIPEETGLEVLESDKGLIKGYVFNYSLFDSHREEIYKRAATLISQNEEDPYFLMTIFKKLQGLRSNYARQKLLFTLDDILESVGDEQGDFVDMADEQEDQQQEQDEEEEDEPEEDIDDFEIVQENQGTVKETFVQEREMRDNIVQWITNHLEKLVGSSQITAAMLDDVKLQVKSMIYARTTSGNLSSDQAMALIDLLEPAIDDLIDRNLNQAGHQGLLDDVVGAFDNIFGWDAPLVSVKNTKIQIEAVNVIREEDVADTFTEFEQESALE